MIPVQGGSKSDESQNVVPPPIEVVRDLAPHQCDFAFNTCIMRWRAVSESWTLFK